ncbi:MAG: hypothetical protein B7Z45_09055, partial [Azorhizobium sp. 12-66-6]
RQRLAHDPPHAEQHRPTGHEQQQQQRQYIAQHLVDLAVGRRFDDQRARADRDAIFQAGLFSDPAWDMLLDLAVAEATGRPISVTSLCIASGVPTTTALRRIDDLKDAGLIDRLPDPRDRRRILVELTVQGRDRMEAFVQRQAGRFGIKLD